MNIFKIVYIDDSFEPELERYLDTGYKNSDFQTEYSEIKFNPNEGYESLVRNPLVQTANIIFIDSRLFENKNVHLGKFSGEEFKIILKKYYPFIEVIVITQNEPDSDVGTISKYNTSCRTTPNEFYNKYLPPLIERAVENVLIYRRLAKKLEKNNSWEKILKEKILNSLNGVTIYDELTESDINKLINAFKEIQENINE